MPAGQAISTLSRSMLTTLPAKSGKVCGMMVNGDQRDDYAAGTGPEDFAAADEIPGDTLTDAETAGSDFADGAAPYGWTRDRKTGTLRAKKRPGRPAVPPSAEELAAIVAAADAAGAPAEREPDRPPAAPQGRRRGRGTPHDPAPAMPRGGIIAAGVDKLYRRAGKILRALDHDIGQALIECTRAELLEEGELTVGQAWEQLAKTNPRIRAFLMKAIAGGAWGDLIMAHAPIGIAIVMKPAVQRFIPWGRVMESMAEPDEDTPEGEGGLPGGMTAADLEDLKATASETARRVAARMGMQVSDEELAEAAASVAGGGVPPAYNRHTRRAAASRARRKS